MKINKIKIIFFDMDGVLVLSEKQHFEAWLKVLNQHKLPTDWMDFNQWIGVSDTMNAKMIIEKFDLDVGIDELHHLKRQIFIDKISTDFEQHLGRDNFLNKVSQHVQVALVSSASQIEIEKILQIEKISHHFSFKIGNEDVSHHKPHPMPYLKALEQSNHLKQHALVIEDSASGIQAAKAAGLPVVGLRTSATLPQGITDSVNFFDDFVDLDKWLFAT
tara:strand:- start:29076 stop:29729 length:654 start_codon:yes stop_codon:yes gene_type:complete